MDLHEQSPCDKDFISTATSILRNTLNQLQDLNSSTQSSAELSPQTESQKAQLPVPRPVLAPSVVPQQPVYRTLS
ncbi:Hypothetical predicted protein [Paramuricea clavata]|uniref:Uncharacterized protein n=1 Tax=Paramuricea clavata TaxID=317549 RepID=A0A7D9K359_PARCT|nr:Hypothetical predicted protein [Paramuricea clavata]